MLEIARNWGTVPKKVTEILQKQVQRKDTITSQICFFLHGYNIHCKFQILQSMTNSMTQISPSYFLKYETWIIRNAFHCQIEYF